MSETPLDEKMSIRHREALCAMLKTNKLPERVVKTYFAVKMYLDRIDAPLSPVGLLWIVSMTGGLVVTDAEAAEAMEPKKEPEPEVAKVVTSGDSEKLKEDTADKNVAKTIAKADEADAQDEAGVVQEDVTTYSPGQTLLIYHNENLVEAKYVQNSGDNLIVEVEGYDSAIEITPEQVEDD